MTCLETIRAIGAKLEEKSTFQAAGKVELSSFEQNLSATGWAEAALMAGRGKYRKIVMVDDSEPLIGLRVVFEFEDAVTAVQFALLF